MPKLLFQKKRNVNTKSGRNNRIFDIQWSVLVNSDTSEKLFNPGSFETQKKICQDCYDIKRS